MSDRLPAPGSTRERLIAEAIALFARKGFAATRTAEIEQAAGLAPGSGGAFRYFPSKRRLLADGVLESVRRAPSFASVVEVGVAGIDAALDSDGDGDVAGAYRALGAALLEVVDDIADPSIVVLREAGVSREEVPELGELAHAFARSHYEGVSTVFAAWLERRGIDVARVDLPVFVYEAFAPLYFARVVRWLLGEAPGGIGDDRLLDAWALTQAALLRQLLEARR